MPNTEEQEISSEATKLIMQIMSQNAKDASYLSDQLIDGYKHSAARANAELAAIRWNINRLYCDGYQPTESAVLDAIWPTHEQIEDFMEISE